METEIRVETPEQYFNVLYDTGSAYLILVHPNSSIKFKKVSIHVIIYLQYLSNLQLSMQKVAKDKVSFALSIFISIFLEFQRII